MNNNRQLNRAKARRRDEFYTTFEDIRRELKHYRRHFRGKCVYCNCDDYRWSQFFAFFRDNFHALGLRRLLCSCYVRQERTLLDDGPPAPAVWVDWDGVGEIVERRFCGDGDCFGEEAAELLRDADVVVTDPPFSRFIEFVGMLVGEGKKFLIVGPITAVSYLSISSLIKHNKVWLGYNPVKCFYQISDDGLAVPTRFGNVGWFTNLVHKRRRSPMELKCLYAQEQYPRYDNIDAIEVSRTAEIPRDYPGVMGVPISFLEHYCPRQFRILGIGRELARQAGLGNFLKIDDKEVFQRLFIKRRRLSENVGS